MSSGQYLKIIVDVLELQSKDTSGFLSKIALDGISNVFKLCEKQNQSRRALDMPKDQRVEKIYVEFENLGGIDAIEKLQEHNHHLIYITAQHILLKYFEQDMSFLAPFE